jgi:hypothetical protein
MQRAPSEPANPTTVGVYERPSMLSRPRIWIPLAVAIVGAIFWIWYFM